MKRYFGIEILRFLTSLSVLLYHYRHFFNPSHNSSELKYTSIETTLPFFNFLEVFYKHGILGVHVFYAISGLVFAHIYLSTAKHVSSKDFFINRFARLYPLHFATLILVVILQYLSFFKFNTFQIVEINDFYHFILNIFFISSWGFEQGHSFNAPIWSVSIEIAIYIAFFFLLTLIKRYRIYAIVFISILLLLIDKTKIFDTLFLECARLFFSGVLVYYICRKSKFNTILLIFSIILIGVSFLGNFKTFLFCPSLLILFVKIDDLITSINIKKSFILFGNLTYALYLLHVPFQIIIIIIFNHYNFANTIFLEHYFFFSFFLILIFLSRITFKFYEKPSNDRIRQKFKK